MLFSSLQLHCLNYRYTIHDIVISKAMQNVFFAKPVSCVNAIYAVRIDIKQQPGHRYTENRLFMGFCTDAYMKKCAYFIVFCPSATVSIGHVAVGAIHINTIKIRLN